MSSSDDYMVDSSGSDGDDDGPMNISLAKERLGFTKEVYTSDEEGTTSSAPVQLDVQPSSAQVTTLTKELTCVVCLQVLYKPVTVSCGHSFCRACVAEVLLTMSNDSGRVKCPLCRVIFCKVCTKRLKTNQTLWQAVQCLFAEACAKRRDAGEDKRYATAVAKLRGHGPREGLGGENGGAHPYGFERVCSSTEDLVIANGGSIKVMCDRVVVRERHDYVMHRALAFVKSCGPFDAGNVRPGAGTVAFRMAILEMEEDESEEEGFPIALSDRTRDTVLIRRATDGEADVWVRDKQTEEELYRGAATIRAGEFRVEVPKAVFALAGKTRICVQDRESECSVAYEFWLSETDFQGLSYVACDTHGSDEDDGRDEDMDEYEDDGFVVRDGAEVSHGRSAVYVVSDDEEEGRPDWSQGSDDVDIYGYPIDRHD